jgi:hypothetical protein
VPTERSSMTKRTIWEIEEDYSEQATRLLRGWYEGKERIARATEAVEGPHTGLFTDAQRAKAAYQQKAERASAEAERRRREYLELTEERNAAVRARARSLRKEVNAVENSEVLTRAALATDAQLGAMAELAATTGNAELGRAVVVVAEQRGLGEVTSRYLDAMGEGARRAYEELKAAPSEEALERKLADADKLFPAPTPADFAPRVGAA